MTGLPCLPAEWSCIQAGWAPAHSGPGARRRVPVAVRGYRSGDSTTQAARENHDRERRHRLRDRHRPGSTPPETPPTTRATTGTASTTRTSRRARGTASSTTAGWWSRSTRGTRRRRSGRRVRATATPRSRSSWARRSTSGWRRRSPNRTPTRPRRLVDPDEEDVDDQVGDERAGRLVAPDEGLAEDVETDSVAEDVGIDGAGASAEEAAVHVIRPTVAFSTPLLSSSPVGLCRGAVALPRRRRVFATVTARYTAGSS